VTTPTGIDYGRHGENLMLVPHRDTQAIVEAVDFLLTNPRERAPIALNGLREARENMSWEKYCADFEAIIERELA
jgi:glycosyltransferase involved in cell wall biosynthesis